MAPARIENSDGSLVKILQHKEEFDEDAYYHGVPVVVRGTRKGFGIGALDPDINMSWDFEVGDDPLILEDGKVVIAITKDEASAP